MDSVRTPDSETAEPGDTPAPAAAASLGKKVRSAARWSLINTVVMRLGTFATGIVLARFALGPAEWGVYGIAQTVLSCSPPTNWAWVWPSCAGRGTRGGSRRPY